ncbi:hypothetical protein CMV_009898 [Castanea mollissima]|uniref:Bulb-type lectin domain-containing protein n=1 Tax=Castanea mollissima TaxID=60419 RepID=A0A8J4RDL2_9ROSI|nr:hypothetical protein CMV_009898 [Castanea mollissima]
MCISRVVLLYLVLFLTPSCPALVAALQAPSYLTPNASTSWTNSLSVPDSVKFDDGSFARIILVSGSSDEVYGACGCGFYCNQTSCNTQLFAIFSLSYQSGKISKSDSPKVLWSANPSINATTLQLTSKKGLVLKDGNGTTAWSTNIGSKSVTGLNLTDMCNLQLLDDKSATIWQSYDHPVNTLFVGQKLVAGQQLTSLGGLFSLHVTRQGFFAYINSIPPQRFFTLAVNKTRYVQFLKDRLYIFSDVSSSLVIPFPSTNFSNRYMRLGADNGHLKVFDIYWGEVYDVFKTNITSCGFPRVCGNYGICTDGQCTCPRPINATRYFQPIEESQPERGCSLITPLSCDASKNHILFELQNITYFPFTQDPPSIIPDLQHRAPPRNMTPTAAVAAIDNGLKIDMQSSLQV